MGEVIHPKPWQEFNKNDRPTAVLPGALIPPGLDITQRKVVDTVPVQLYNLVGGPCDGEMRYFNKPLGATVVINLVDNPDDPKYTDWSDRHHLYMIERGVATWRGASPQQTDDEDAPKVIILP